MSSGRAAVEQPEIIELSPSPPDVREAHSSFRRLGDYRFNAGQLRRPVTLPQNSRRTSGNAYNRSNSVSGVAASQVPEVIEILKPPEDLGIPRKRVRKDERNNHLDKSRGPSTFSERSNSPSIVDVPRDQRRSSIASTETQTFPYVASPADNASIELPFSASVAEAKNITIINTNGANTNFFSSQSLTVGDPILDSLSLTQSMLPSSPLSGPSLPATCPSCLRKPKMVHSEAQCNLLDEPREKSVDKVLQMVSVSTMTENSVTCSSVRHATVVGEPIAESTTSTPDPASDEVTDAESVQSKAVMKESGRMNELVHDSEIEQANVIATKQSRDDLARNGLKSDDSDESNENDEYFADLLFKNIDNGKESEKGDGHAPPLEGEGTKNKESVGAVEEQINGKNGDREERSAGNLYDNMSDVSSSDSSEPENSNLPLTLKVVETKSLAEEQSQYPEPLNPEVAQSQSELLQTSSSSTEKVIESICSNQVIEISSEKSSEISMQSNVSSSNTENRSLSRNNNSENASAGSTWVLSNVSDSRISIKRVDVTDTANSSTGEKASCSHSASNLPETEIEPASSCVAKTGTIPEEEASSSLQSNESITELLPSHMPIKFKGHVFQHPIISPKKVELKDLDGYTKLSYLYSQEKSEMSEQSFSTSAGGKGKKRASLVIKKRSLYTSSDENHSSSAETAMTRSQGHRGSYRALKRRKLLLDSNDSDSEEARINNLLKKPKIPRHQSSSSRNSSPRKRSVISGTRSMLTLDSDDSDFNNGLQSQSLFPKMPKKTQSAHKSLQLDSDYFDEEVLSPERHSSNDTTDIDSMDDLNREDLVLGEEDLDVPLKNVKKETRKMSTSQGNANADNSNIGSSQHTVVLSSGSESAVTIPEDAKESPVKLIIKRPSFLTKLNVELNDGNSKRQTSLNFNSYRNKKTKRTSVKTERRVYRTIHGSSSSDIDSYDLSSDDNIMQASVASRTATSTASSFKVSSASTSKSSTLQSETSTSRTSSGFCKFKHSKKAAAFNRTKEFRLSDSEGSRGESEDDQPLKAAHIVKKIKSRSLSERQKRLTTQENNSSDDEVKTVISSVKKSARKPRAILTEKELNQQTRKAAREEKDRIARVKGIDREGLDAFEVVNGKKVYSHVWLEKCPKTNQPLVDVNENIVGKLKEHQVQGIHFMYDCTIEAVRRAKKFDGGGCILAHCMGLGKTLQVVSFLDAVLTSPSLKHFSSALIIAPCSTLDNWKREFKCWLLGEANFHVLNLDRYKSEKSLQMQALDYWRLNGGVMIIGYEAFAILVKKATEDSDIGKNVAAKASKPKPKCKQPMSEEFKEIVVSSLLDPGPDIVICDEGHQLKNDKTMKAISINKIRTLRRIMLTGTPLQNNLDEYYVMSNFVKPHLLGTKKEFRNRFSGPITRGQQKDAHTNEVKRMQRQSHVLHKQLSGCVDRKDFSYIKKLLPPKYEYTLEIRLSQLQIDLYSKYLKLFVQASHQVNTEVDQMEQVEIRKSAVTKGNLLKNCHAFARILAHPVLVKLKRAEITSNSKLDDDDFGFENLAADILKVPGVQLPEEDSTNSGANPTTVSNDDCEKEWFEYAKSQLVAYSVGSQNIFDINASGKFVLLCEILKMSHQKGDKLLLFSQRIDFLDLIESMFKMFSKAQSQSWRKGVRQPDGFRPTINGLEAGDCKWIINQNYFRLDGSTSTKERKRICKKFNDPQSSARLLLISTRAGSLGINLVAANRVILFDASWNPSHDIQSMFRVYRFGQAKPCYIYRFISKGTIEQKIYFRQVLKESLSERVVDKNAKERNFTKDDVSELYRFTVATEESPVTTVPSDNVLADLVLKHPYWIGNHYEHDTLLQDDADDLNEEEKRIAWEEYERERERAHTPPPNVMNNILGSDASGHCNMSGSTNIPGMSNMHGVNYIPGMVDMHATSNISGASKQPGPSNPNSTTNAAIPNPPPFKPGSGMQSSSSPFVPISTALGTSGGGRLMGNYTEQTGNQQLPSLIYNNLPLPPIRMGDKSSIDSSNLESAILDLSISRNKKLATASEQVQSGSKSSEKSGINPKYLNSIKPVMRNQLLSQLKGKVKIDDSKIYVERYFEENAASLKTPEDFVKFKKLFVEHVKKHYLKM